ncbi:MULTISPECIES: transketolase family protein [Prochlorococcus]|uniref:1-deoxy-xylulose 5-phosphate synthase n=1 Tax=Prochlorococcus marinus (strain SARG / CCMP1375 / SS120) TaxID=167539 RepID=Q7VB19_PROMA|nr:MULTISPECIES: 1-deoxy-D-xylulose-5-phosphate synthase [Prochlorococcus]AAQ00325.1 1-deoxy-xylulose 5-phosphate synthase [Prochlorococcus marinus subsp. marinus str. CCMP1375]KGG10181.1 Transketolase [Prochlorococcus marinus str. LG]KGG22225.1 Transketolase [Prochlorococcus marinus str. SS2]KGG24458.1 Transketolase [Prochlorococcus marinus str. SS35]KGG33353.1 Transketolase [Prochlorococcus marinus str. SS51]
MRNSFATTLTEIARNDPKVILLAGDIGFRIFDKFIEEFPDRFINCGIAEQNMVSVAAGMASAGRRPIVYTIIPFLIMRSFEQIRVDIGINQQGVVLVGVGGGLAYDKLGSTHHAYEDIALMRTIPSMKIFTPIDPEDVSNCFIQSYNLAKSDIPSYIRLSKGGEPNITRIKEVSSNIKFLKSSNITSNLFITHGSISSLVVDALEDNKYSNVSVISISELSKDSLLKLTNLLIENLQLLKQVSIVEETFPTGGLHEALSSILMKENVPLGIKHICLDHRYIFDINNRVSLLSKYGIEKSIIQEIALKK